jgi:hypothetical protein
METVIALKYSCGREIMLEIVGGQYQDTYEGKCRCGRKWVLTDISEMMAEITDEGDIRENF